MPGRYHTRVSRATYGLFAVLILTLATFGSVADRALVGQARSAAEAARTEDERRAQLTGQAVRATIAQIEQAVVGDTPWPGVSVARVVDSQNISAPRPSEVPYGRRAERELLALLTSTGLSGSGLPEAVVAAVALARPGHRAKVGERLLSGILPVRPEDLSYLADVLGFAADPRVESLRTRLLRAPDDDSLPVTPTFQRALTDRGSIEGWSRSAAMLQHYEISIDELLRAAGVAGRASLSRGLSLSRPDAGPRIVAVPEVNGLALMIAPAASGQLRVRALRIVLWVAVLTSILGLAAVLRGLRREARAVAREKAFLSSVTHELRTPLAAIRLLGERLAENRGDPKEYGGMVAAESERLETLVERVLAATRADERLALTPLDPANLVSSAVKLITPWAEKREVVISIDGSLRETLLPEVVWDQEAVRRALLNLLDNAIKHGRHGGLVTVSATVANGYVKLSVTDDGPGIGRRDRKRVFGRFERGPTEGPGTGLGLYVAERIACAHGGRVELLTEESRGSTFTLVLPVVPPEAPMAETRSATA